MSTPSTTTRPASFTPITIADGVRTSALRTPKKVALQEGRRTLTYAQLIERVDRVSSGVADGLALSRGQHSAIMAWNCLEFVEIVLGPASAGVPPALVDPRSSAEELVYICNDAEARVLFVHPSLEDLARSADLETVEQIVVIGPAYENWLAHARPTRPRIPIEEWDIFCIPYTSGTTGRPKGVLLSHRSRVLTLFGMGVEYGCYSPEDRTLGIAPLSHGAGFAFSIAAVFFGGYCATVQKFDAEEVLRLLAERRITNTFMVPTHFHTMFELGEKTIRSHDTGTLKTIISNAAPLSQAMKERIVAHFGETILFEAYGSTEASIVSNLRPSCQLRKHQCVGLPFVCTSVRLLDTDGNEVPPGRVGELYSHSPYLFNGYWKRPDDTEAAMRDGWFSAGDLARRDEEGYIYLVDRKNDKIISGGTNIYPREIEEVLLGHPAVVEAAAFGVPDERLGEMVRAVVVLKPGAVATQELLIEFCRDHLARYKLPKAIDFAPRLPRNAVGKILRRELRDPFWTGYEPRIS